MATKIVYIGVVILALIAIFLGYKIYQQQAAINNVPSINLQSQDKSTPPLTNQATTDAIQQSADERQVLNFPGPNATEAEIKAHSDLVNKLGNESGTAYLDISGCMPDPVVYRVQQGGSFRIKNPDGVDHTIYTDPQKKIVIEASSELTVISINVGNTLGDYGYNCDGSTNPVGIIQIVP